MKLYKLKFNKTLNESKQQFKNLQIGDIIQTSPQLLWHRDGTGFHKSTKHITDIFIVLDISGNEFSIIEKDDYNLIVKFLHLRGDDLSKLDETDFRDFILSKNQAPDKTLLRDSFIECDCIYDLDFNLNFRVRGQVLDSNLIPKVIEFINKLIDMQQVVTNQETDNSKQPQKQINHIKENIENFKPYRYIDNSINFICNITEDAGDYISGTISFKNINYVFGYDYFSARLEMQDIDTDGFTSILYNYDDTYQLNYDDNELTDIDIDILANCFIDVIIDYDRFNRENNWYREP